MEFLRSSQKLFPSWKFWNIFSLGFLRKDSSREFFSPSQKFCPYFYCKKKEILWENDRTFVAPTYPVDEGIMSNVVPLRDKKIWNFTKKPTEADIGRLRISFLRIQVERSSNTKKYLKGINGVTEVYKVRLRISLLRILVWLSSLLRDKILSNTNTTNRMITTN